MEVRLTPFSIRLCDSINQSRDRGDMGTTVMEKSVKDNGKESAKSAKSQLGTEERPLRTLAIDIGATGLKAVVLNEISAP